MKQRFAFIAFLVLSGALHAAGAIAIAPARDSVLMEGGGAASVALLGDSFEDLAQGAQPVMATETSAVQPVTTVTVTPASTPPAPVPAAAPAPALSVPVAHAADLAASPATPAAPSEPPVAAEPVQVPLAAPPAPATLAPATDVASSAPETSPRPQARAEKPVKRQKTAEPRPASSAGNADRNARKGSQTGQENANAPAAQSARSGGQQAGNAAKSTYPGLVLRKIERTRKPATSARGSVVVAFRVAPSGALASAQVARSTGDPVLERAALDHIRRAAPFPPPPAGADIDFRFEFVGRR